MRRRKTKAVTWDGNDLLFHGREGKQIFGLLSIAAEVTGKTVQQVLHECVTRAFAAEARDK